MIGFSQLDCRRGQKTALMTPVFQQTLPYAPWMHPATRRMPGVQPLDLCDWITCDDAYGGQMALRDALIGQRRDEVFACLPEAEDAALETLAYILAHLPQGFTRRGQKLTRPDGVEIDLEADHPLIIAGRLVQQDIALLMKEQGEVEHRLVGAILCFPASWTLAEKIGRPLAAIHTPVKPYTGEMATRVQRLFDMVREDRPLWRQNALLYGSPDLFHPRSEVQPRVKAEIRPDYLRSERQCILRLPQTGAVIFSIHTYLLRFADLSADQVAALEQHPIDYAGRNL